MSVQAMSWVIENSEAKGGDYVVLLMIANHARSDGTGSFAGLERLARESRRTPRSVINSIHRLEDIGELAVDKLGSPYGTNAYSLPKMRSSKDSNGEKISPLPDSNGENHRPNPAQIPAPIFTLAVINGNRRHDPSALPLSPKNSESGEREKRRRQKAPSASPQTRKDGGLQPERDLIEWMKDTARTVGHKHWRLSGQPGGKGNRYQGPTEGMEEALREKESLYASYYPEFFRQCWVDFLHDPASDGQRFPFSTFLHAFLPKALDAEHERTRKRGEPAAWLKEIEERNARLDKAFPTVADSEVSV
jgi:hypothetical protein